MVIWGTIVKTNISNRWPRVSPQFVSLRPTVVCCMGRLLRNYNWFDWFKFYKNLFSFCSLLGKKHCNAFVTREKPKWILLKSKTIFRLEIDSTYVSLWKICFHTVIKYWTGDKKFTTFRFSRTVSTILMKLKN